MAARDEETRSVCLEASECVQVHSWWQTGQKSVGVCASEVCVREFVECVCVCETEAQTRQKGASGLEQSEKMKDELEQK